MQKGIIWFVLPIMCVAVLFGLFLVPTEVNSEQLYSELDAKINASLKLIVQDKDLSLVGRINPKTLAREFEKYDELSCSRTASMGFRPQTTWTCINTNGTKLSYDTRHKWSGFSGDFMPEGELQWFSMTFLKNEEMKKWISYFKNVLGNESESIQSESEPCRTIRWNGQLLTFKIVVCDNGSLFQWSRK